MRFDINEISLDLQHAMHIAGMPWKRYGKEKGTQQGVTTFCCAFQRDSGCQYKCRILRNLCDGSCSIEQTKSIAHADHKKKITKTGVHKLVKAEFLKPGSNLQQGSSKNIRRVLQELDVPDRDGKMLYQAMQFRQRERNKELTQLKQGAHSVAQAPVVEAEEGGGVAKKQRVKLQATLPPHLSSHV